MIFLGESLGSVTLKMDMAQNDDIPFWNSFRSYKCPALCCYSNFEPMHEILPSQRNPDFAWQKRDKDVWHFCLAPKPISEATSCSWVNHPDLFGKDFLLWKRCGSFFCSAQFRPNPGLLSMMVSGHRMSIRSIHRAASREGKNLIHKVAPAPMFYIIICSGQKAEFQPFQLGVSWHNQCEIGFWWCV